MKKVICIDDNPQITEQLRINLEAAGFDILEAQNGVEGLKTVQENTDCLLIIVDLNMPRMGGFEMLETLSQENIATDVPKIIFTTESLMEGENSKKMKEKGKSMGVQTWFTKPLTPKRMGILLETVKKLLKKNESTSS
ncbi:response regulator [Bacteriovoracales bacterium]|nr:response regulator [Bacteriovoracales bacterium]